MQFTIASRARDVARVIDLVTGFEQTHLGANCLHHAGGIPTDHPRLHLHLVTGRAHFGIDRVDRDRLHPHQQIARAGLRIGKIDIHKALRVGNRQVAGQCNGFHRVIP